MAAAPNSQILFVKPVNLAAFPMSISESITIPGKNRQ